MENGRNEKIRIAVIQAIGTIGSHQHHLSVEGCYVHVAVGIKVGNGCKGEVNVLAVLPDVDAVFAVVQRHGHLCRRSLQRLPADDG